MSYPIVEIDPEDGQIGFSWLDRTRDRSLLFSVTRTGSIEVIWSDHRAGGGSETSDPVVLKAWMRWFDGRGPRPWRAETHRVVETHVGKCK